MYSDVSLFTRLNRYCMQCMHAYYVSRPVHTCMYVCSCLDYEIIWMVMVLRSFIHSFIPAISIAPLQVLYHSEALPTTAQILYKSFTPKRTGNCSTDTVSEF